MRYDDDAGARTDRRVLDLLCRGDLTAREVGAALGISANAARAHLNRLRDDGLLERRVERRGVGKPTHVFALSDAGALRVSRAYLPFLRGLLDAAEARGAVERDRLMGDAGRGMVRGVPPPSGDPAARADEAGGLLRALGARCTVQQRGDGWSIVGECCPLRAAVGASDATCEAVRAMLAAYLSTPVRARCDRAGIPSCRMDIGA